MLKSVYLYIYIHYSPLLVYIYILYTYYIHIRIYTYYMGCCRGGYVSRRRGGGGCHPEAVVADQSDGKSTSSPEAKATRDARAMGRWRRVVARAVCTLYLNNRARTAGGAHTRVLSRTSAGVGGVARREVRIIEV